MRNSVTVDGITLTRDQVERAQQALNRPEIDGGDIVTCIHFPGGKQFVVVGATLASTLNKKYGASEGLVRITDGNHTWLQPLSSLKKVGSL